MSFIIRHLEIVLTVLGLGVIFGVTAIFTPEGVSPWHIAAITAVLVGVVHGGIFWLVRRRQRAVRLAVIREMQAMLKDIINNQLAVIQAMSNLQEADREHARVAGDYISRSVTTISEALHHLSDESLRTWQAKYNRPVFGGSTNTPSPF